MTPELVVQEAISTLQPVYGEAVARELMGENAAPIWDEFAAILVRTIVMSGLSAMAGVFDDVRANEGDVPPDTFARPFEFAEPAASVSATPSFVSIEEFAAAVNLFRERVPRLRATVDRMMAEANQIAAMVAEAEHQQVIELLATRLHTVQTAIQQSFWASDSDPDTIVNLRALVAEFIRGGTETVLDDEMKTQLVAVGLRDVIELGQLSGAANLTEARLETIVRTNAATVQNEAETRAMMTPEARRVLPLTMLTNPVDPRSRPEHAAMNGYINTIDAFVDQGIVPANGYNCRCGMRAVPMGEASRMGLLNETGEVDATRLREHNGARQDLIDQGLYPDEGFEVARVA